MLSVAELRNVLNERSKGKRWWGRGGTGMGRDCQCVWGFFSDENVIKLDCGDGCVCEYTKTH